jgi:hypothetical protein
MLQVLVDKAEMNLEVSRMRTMGELVEYIKSSIDPDLIILSLTRDDQPLTDADWKTPLSALDNSKVEVLTGSKMDFFQDRLRLIDAIVTTISDNIKDIAAFYKKGMQDNAHDHFAVLLNDLNAFISWLHSIYMMDEDLFANEISNYTILVEKLNNSCNELQQAQVKYAWWAVGDILEMKILPSIASINEMSKKSLERVLS